MWVLAELCKGGGSREEMQGDERGGNGGERQGTRREEDGKEERQKKWVTQSTRGPEKGRREREKGNGMGRMGRMEAGAG